MEKARKEATRQLTKQEEREIEIRSILMKADEDKTETLVMGNDYEQISFKSEVDSMLDVPIDDPQKKYELYYNVISKLLLTHLPKGKEYEKARIFIYDERATFLTRGHRKDARGIRHADSRMGYNPDMKEFARIVVEWVFQKGTMFDLYTKLRELNKSKGYPME